MNRPTPWVALAALFGAACDSGPVTQIVVVIDTDLRVPDELDAVFIEVEGPSTARADQTVPLRSSGASPLPLTFGMVPAGQLLGPLRVTVAGRLAGTDVVTRVVRTRFVEGRALLLPIPLSRRCSELYCATDTTCAEGDCRPELVEPYTLAPFDGTPHMSELCNGRDDDGDRAIDEDFDLTTNARNCGGCGMKCLAGRTCEGSVCIESPITAISAGWTHTCALRASGGVTCWGSNYYGELGDGSTLQYSYPGSVVGLSDAVTIAVGAGTSCVVRETGGVACWGGGTEGELGIGVFENRSLPAETVGFTDAARVSTGWFHGCALRAGGGARCWGHGGVGQLGNGTTPVKVEAAVDVLGLSDATDIDVGFEHTCARRASGAVVCWGAGPRGQLGNGATRQQTQPVPVTGSSAGASLSLGATFSCAITPTGEVMCWGSNDVGELGVDPATTMQSSTPVMVAGLPVPMTQVSAAAPHDVGAFPDYGRTACARAMDGRVFCWGENGFGQLGDGTMTSRFTPAPVSGLTDVQQVSVGAAHACALTATGEVLCWGANDYGQLGDGTVSTTPLPVRVVGL